MKTILLTFRKLRRNRTATLLGIAGLVVGLVCVMYIFLWVSDEVSFDRFHANSDRIAVVHAYLDGGAERMPFRGCPPAVGPALKNEYPEVVNYCRYIPAYWQNLVSYGDVRFIEKTAISDFSLFDIFSLPFVYGNKGDENVANRIVLTETVAKKYFGVSNPVGKVVRLNNQDDMVVVGVIADIPQNSSITFDAVIPSETIKKSWGNEQALNTWYNNAFTTYCLLDRPESFEKISDSITRRIQKELPESTNYLRAFRFNDGYLYEQKNIHNVKIYSLIALLVLLASTLNFTNLSTARSSKQAKETGIRKTIGATRTALIRLIYSEMAVVCLIAFTLAITLTMIGLPLFNRSVGKAISPTILFSMIPMGVLGVIYLFTVLISGSYPAFFLSSFSPGQTLSSGYQSAKSRGLFRSALVVLVFAVSMTLMASTFIISKQVSFLQKMDLGFEKDQLLYISLKGKLRDQSIVLKEELKRSPDVLAASVVSNLPTMIGNNGENWNWEGKAPEFKPLVTDWATDEELISTFGAKMAEGNYLAKDRSGIVINKTFADLIGWESFSGKALVQGGNSLTVLGVIDDIRFNSLSAKTGPMAIRMIEDWGKNYLIVKVNTANVRTTLDFIRNTCKNMEPAFPAEYAFLNQEYEKLLASEANLQKLIGIFSGFAIVVLCLGLLGVILFATEQKTKEIGIRKCMGEEVGSIVLRFIKPFLWAGGIATTVAIPATWYLMNQWLQTYANRIQLNIWVFLLSGIIAITIAVITVIWQSWRAATRNPVEALRYE